MKHTRFNSTLAMSLAMLFWGVAWTAGKVSAAHAPATVAAFWRYAISFFALIPVLWYLHPSWRSDRATWVVMLIAGILTSLFNYLFFAGLQAGHAGYGGTLVTALSPILTYLILLPWHRIARHQLIALLIGGVAAVILLRLPWEGIGVFTDIHSGYFIGCALVWALVSILSQYATRRINPFVYSFIVFGLTALFNLLFALPDHPLGTYDTTFWWVILFVGVVPGTFGTTIFFLSAGQIGAARTAVFMFIVPVGAILSSWMIYDEVPTLSTLMGCALALIAVVVFNQTSRRPHEP